jgi:hypothetical protein
MNRGKTVGDEESANQEKTVSDGAFESRVSRNPVSDALEVALLSELIDALAHLGEYAPKRLNGISRAERFLHALESLEANAREALVGMLISSALGRLEATRWYTRTSLELVLELCDLRHATLFTNQRDELEHALERAVASGRPLRQKLELHPPNGRAFLGTWTHAVKLWQVITALHSPQASRLLTALLRATDDRALVSSPRPEPSREACHWMPRTLTW